MAYVYILASRKNGTLYVGVTRDLIRRIYEHKSGVVEGFTKNIKLTSLSGSIIQNLSSPPSSAKNKSKPGSATGRSA